MRFTFMFLLLAVILTSCSAESVPETDPKPVEQESDTSLVETGEFDETPSLEEELRSEMVSIIVSGKYLGQDHYKRIQNDIDALEAQGLDVDWFRKKVTELKVATDSGNKKLTKVKSLPWVHKVMTQPLAEGASSVRLILPAPIEKIPLTKIGAFGAHSGAHLEGLDHEWIYIKDETPIGSWADGTVYDVRSESGNLWRVFIDYGDGLFGQHMSVATPLVEEGDVVKAGDPIGYGEKSDWPKGYHFAEFYLLDQNRQGGIEGIYVPNSVAVSPFDYLTNNSKEELLAAYQKEVVEPYFEKGKWVDTVYPWEPYLTNPMLLHRTHQGTLVGEWILNQKWVSDGIPEVIAMLPPTEYYDKQRVLAMDYLGYGMYLFQGDWETKDNKITMDTDKGIYYGIYELDESNDRATLKIEYQLDAHPTKFSSQALTYIERDSIDVSEDAVRLGVLQR